ncbi:MAG: trigger factor family protein, partial [Proteobacteria bacterium]|nr:trigger factor family protein [Pseudomonadota bacterium]
MKVTTEKPEPGVATLTVELPPEDFTTAVDKALTRIAGRTSVPGFRRGKAPRNLVRRQVGEAAVNEEAINHLV